MVQPRSRQLLVATGGLLLLLAAPLPAHGAYATGTYWPLPDGNYGYEVTVWNNTPEDYGPIHWVALYIRTDVFDVDAPPGWRSAPDHTIWYTFDQEAYIWPGEWLGGFEFSDSRYWPGVDYVLEGDKDGGYLEFEMIPEPSAVLPVAAIFLAAMGYRKRRVR